MNQLPKTPHSDIVGGSSVGRLIACPGSYKLSKTVPPRETSEYAAEGTALHEAISYVLEEQPKKDTAVIGLEFKGLKITEDLYNECIAPALGYLDTIVMSYPDLEFYVEKQVQFDRVPGAFGTTDLIGISKKHKVTVINDWKFGSGVPVSANRNPQLMFYAYGAMVTPETTALFGTGDDWRVELHVAQPRMGSAGYSSWATTTKQLRAFAREVVTAIGQALSAEPPFSLGEHCKFCPAKAVCPLLVDNAFNIAIGQGYDLAKLSEYMARAELIEEWVLGLRQLVQQRLEAGHPVAGWKLVAKRGMRRWIDEAAAIRWLRKSKLSEDQYAPRSLISPPQAEKILKKLDGAPVAVVSSGTTLAPENDTRPALSVSVTALAEALKRIGR